MPGLIQASAYAATKPSGNAKGLYAKKFHLDCDSTLKFSASETLFSRVQH